VKYELLGAAPNRRLVISWDNVKLYNQTARYNFQVALYESPTGGLDSNFKFQYTTGSSTGSAATVGVQVSTADYTLYSYNQSFIDPVAGSAILWYPANQLAGRGAEYRFDEASWNGTAGEVKDTSGGGQNAVRAGAATNVSGGYICRGGSFTSNTSNATVDAVATPIVPASTGSVDFWFNSNVKWNSADAILLDATTAAARPFFLMKTSAGALKFSVTDSSGTVMSVSTAAKTFALNTWHHVGMSWNLKPGTNQTLLQIFLDGVLSTSLRTTSNGAINPTSTLYIGDNRTSGITPTGGSPNGANGVIDEVNVYPTEINPAQAAADMNESHTCSSVDHFHVVHGGTAVTCATAPITIEAHDASHALVALSGTTMSLSTSNNHGNWTNVTGGAVNLVTNNGNGSGSYVFSGESRVILGLQNPVAVAESLTIGASAGAITTTSGSASSCVAADYTFGNSCNTPLSFSLAGFIFSTSAGGSLVTVPAQIAGTSSATYYLRAVKTNTTTKACEAALTNPSAVNFAYECNNPTTCSPSNLMSVNGGTATTIPRNNNGSVASYSSVNMAFDGNGNAPFTFNFGDVGAVTLYANKAASGSLLTALTGASNSFVVAPASFAFSGITTAPIKAGNNFSATVTARTSAGVATPNFGKETVPESVTLTFAKYQPTGAGAVNGSFSGSVGSFSGGSATASNLNWSEVGTIDLTATLASGSYLGSGLSATGNTGTTGAVGRFIPDHFDVAVTQGCGTGGFTYSAQPFAVTVTAKNALAATTLNYDGSGNTTPNFSKAVTLSEANAVAGGLSPTSVAANAFAAGVATATPAFTFTTTPTAPATIKLRAVDTDAVTSASGTEGTAAIRSGRLRIFNAFGSEKVNLGLPVQTQYWSGQSWVLNSQDSCTSIPANAFNLIGAPTGTSVNAVVTISGGNGTLTLTKPSPTSTGSVDIAANLGASGSDQSCLASHGGTAANLPWLRSRNGNCASTYDRDPSARASFGIYSPETKRTIHVREQF
jgi:MSHA biogenesis protein MshQ